MDVFYNSDHPMGFRGTQLQGGEVSISTDSNGNGSKTVNFTNTGDTVNLDYHISVTARGSNFDVWYTKSNNDFTIHVANAPASSTVTVSAFLMTYGSGANW